MEARGIAPGIRIAVKNEALTARFNWVRRLRVSLAPKARYIMDSLGQRPRMLSAECHELLKIFAASLATAKANR